MSNETKQLIINYIYATLFVFMIASVEVKETPVVHAQNNEVVVSSPTPTAELTTEVQNDTPESYIRKVFGKHADKAFLLLKGNGAGSCAENRTLDQKAKNRNWIKGKPGEYWSTDWGIFQINDHFHPVEELNLRTDFKANIDYAWRMYKNNGYSFERWTCGRIYGI